MSSIVTGAHAATFSLTNEPVTLDRISARNILSGPGTERAISLGPTTGTLGIDGTVGDLTVTPPGVINTRFNQNINTLWQLRFAIAEFFGPVTVEVNYTVIDNSGMTGFLNSVFVPTSRIAVTATLFNLRERRRLFGALRDLRGGAAFDIDIRQAISSGAHSGTLVVEVNFM